VDETAFESRQEQENCRLQTAQNKFEAHQVFLEVRRPWLKGEVKDEWIYNPEPHICLHSVDHNDFALFTFAKELKNWSWHR